VVGGKEKWSTHLKSVGPTILIMSVTVLEVTDGWLLLRGRWGRLLSLFQEGQVNENTSIRSAELFFFPIILVDL
jgi:hypothetical protein